MSYVPTKRCTELKRHEPHPWTQDKHFKRWCPGRITDRLPSRSQRKRKA